MTRSDFVEREHTLEYRDYLIITWLITHIDLDRPTLREMALFVVRVAQLFHNEMIPSLETINIEVSSNTILQWGVRNRRVSSLTSGA